MRCAIRILVLVSAFLLGGSTRSVASAPERCGSYALVRGKVPAGGERLTLVDRAGRRVHQILGAVVRVERCEDVTGNGQPELVLSTFSGGQRCCTTFQVLALGARVVTILRWEAGYEWELESTNLADATRARELVGRDDRLSGFGGLPLAFSPTLPALFCYERGAFADCTRRIREPLLLELTEVKETLKVETNPVRRRANGVSVVALSLLLDEEAAAWTWLAELAADIVPWLRDRRTALMTCMKASALVPRNTRLARCTAGEHR